jgi:DNA ligase-1
MIVKPMLAATLEDENDIKFPVLATKKLDGIRCLKLSSKVLSRSFKGIPNSHIVSALSLVPDGLDGELMVRNSSFNDTQSGVMSEDGEPDFEYWVFDYVKNDIKKPYVERMKDLEALDLPPFCVKVLPTLINSSAELLAYEAIVLAEGHEGVMLRSPSSPYKCGRATLREGFLSKLKRFKDSEAVITGFEERLHNANEATTDELGHTKRSSHKANMVPINTLGAFLVRDIHDGREFKIGTGIGLNDELRKQIWETKDQYLGKIVNYRYQECGSKDLPRIPSYQGFRDKRDM